MIIKKLNGENLIQRAPRTIVASYLIEINYTSYDL